MIRTEKETSLEATVDVRVAESNIAANVPVINFRKLEI